MKKIVVLLAGLLIGGLCFTQTCEFSDEYQEQIQYFEAERYLEYWYPNMDENRKIEICKCVAECYFNPYYDFNYSLEQAVEMFCTIVD